MDSISKVLDALNRQELSFEEGRVKLRALMEELAKAREKIQKISDRCVGTVPLIGDTNRSRGQK